MGLITMKTIIAGSREIRDYSILIEAVKECPWEITEVVSGTAQGPDRLGQRYARENKLPLYNFPAAWKRHGVVAGVIRNTEMAKNAQALLAIWDGRSTGTSHMISEARKLNLHVYIKYVFRPVA
jgi:hypothetical protein